MKGPQPERLAQRGDVACIIVQGSGDRLTLAVSPAIEANHSEPLGETRGHAIPTMVVGPRSVDQHQRRSRTLIFISEPGAIDRCDGQSSRTIPLFSYGGARSSNTT